MSTRTEGPLRRYRNSAESGAPADTERHALDCHVVSLTCLLLPVTWDDLGPEQFEYVSGSRAAQWDTGSSPAASSPPVWLEWLGKEMELEEYTMVVTLACDVTEVITITFRGVLSIGPSLYLELRIALFRARAGLCLSSASSSLQATVKRNAHRMIRCTSLHERQSVASGLDFGYWSWSDAAAGTEVVVHRAAEEPADAEEPAAGIAAEVAVTVMVAGIVKAAGVVAVVETVAAAGTAVAAGIAAAAAQTDVAACFWRLTLRCHKHHRRRLLS